MTQSLADDMQHNNRMDHGDEGIIVFIMEHEMREWICRVLEQWVPELVRRTRQNLGVWLQLLVDATAALTELYAEWVVILDD